MLACTKTFKRNIMTYEQMLNGKEVKNIKEYVISNDRNDSKEMFIMGIVDMIKRNGEKYKKNINNSQIKVSWIKEPDYSHSLTDICVENNGKGAKRDFGWRTVKVQVQVMLQFTENNQMKFT